MALDTWYNKLPSASLNFYGVACSSGGAKAVAAAYDDYLYVTSDSGQTWDSIGSISGWAYLAISSSAQYIFSVDTANSAITVSDDSGATSSQEFVNTDYYLSRLCCSSSGQYAYALARDSINNLSLVLGSDDYGVTWNTVYSVSFGTDPFWHVACSSNGASIIVTGLYGGIYFSDDAGETWTKKVYDPEHAWGPVACTSDAGIVYVLDNYGSNGTDIFISTDFGDTWTTKTIPFSSDYYDIQCSADGTKIVIGARNLLVSEDSGNTWATIEDDQEWYTVALSDDGSVAYASVAYVGIFLTVPPSASFSITGITPASGYTKGGTPVTITGTGFDPAATAAIDGNDLTELVVVNDTTITGKTPPGTLGAKDVTVTNP